MLRKVADFLRWFFGRRELDWTSWDPLRFTAPLVFGLIFVVPEAFKESLAATRQQTSEGIITSYSMSDHNQCQYSFTVKRKMYSGMSSAPTFDTTTGNRVLVYFDSQNPEVNALEDLSVKSRRDRGFLWMLLTAIGSIVILIILSKIVRRLTNS